MSSPAPVPPLPAEARLPSLDAMRAFEAAARLGTFERAADELHLTASAIGKRIAALEDLLAVALFQRGAKSLTLSAAGKEYLLQVRQALALLASMPLHQRASQQRQRLRLSAPPTFARHILVPALPAFATAHPEIEREVVLSVPFLDAQLSDADLDVRHAPVATPAAAGGRPSPNLAAPPPGPGDAPLARRLAAEGLAAQVLMNDVLMDDVLLPLASPGLLAQHGPLDGPEDLARLPLLRTPVEPWAPWLRAVGLDWPEPDRGPRLVDLGMTLEAALCGQGVALARPALARSALRSGALQPVFGAGRTPLAHPATAYQLLPHGQDASVTAAAEWLRQACAQAAAEGLALVSGPA